MTDPSKNGDIDLIQLAKTVWERRYFIFKVTGFVILVGLIMALTSPKEYKASSILILESSESSTFPSEFGGVASLVGINLGDLASPSQGINPTLYESISNSTPFLLELMSQEFYFEELDKKISLYDYYSDHINVSLISKLKSAPGKLMNKIVGKKSEISLPNLDSIGIYLSEENQRQIEDLAKRIKVEMDYDLNVVNIEAKMQDPIVTAQITQFTRDYITEYVTAYAISKSERQLGAIEEQYQIRKKEFEAAQNRLAAFRDNNLNVTTAQARTLEERLQSEFNLSFEIYEQIAKQKELMELKVQEDTPVFTVLEPIKIPSVKSEPKRLMILILSGLTGSLLGCFIIITRLVILKNYQH